MITLTGRLYRIAVMATGPAYTPATRYVTYEALNVEQSLYADATFSDTDMRSYGYEIGLDGVPLSRKLLWQIARDGDTLLVEQPEAKPAENLTDDEINDLIAQAVYGTPRESKP